MSDQPKAPAPGADREATALQVFADADPLGAVYDRAWAAIMNSEELKRARGQLSLHELRLIIRAAITGKTDQ
jgi:hypothetical protein